MISGTPATRVVICYWTGQPIKNLYRLLAQMQKVDAGSPFDTVIVANGGDLAPVVLPSRFDDLRATVINRENHGYNIEAWDVGWRDKAYEFYLFLQSECFLKTRNWVADFEFRMARDRGIGLLGERYLWEQMTWSFIREATDRDLGDSVWPKGEPLHPIDNIRDHLERHGYPLTDLGSHLVSIIQFTSRAVLEEVNGYPRLGSTYRAACAGEIGFSRVIASKGYRISKIRDRDFSVIGHRQYTLSYDLHFNARNKLRSALKKVGLKR
jgi:hypothetical protein